MQKINLSKNIKASKEKVWDTIVDKEKYNEWSRVAFDGYSTFIGDWSQGGEMKFVGSSESGIIEKVEKAEKFKTIEMKTVGMLVNGEEDRTSKEALDWCSYVENYYLTEMQNGETEFKLYQEVKDEFYESFIEMWEVALERIKIISEREEKTITVSVLINESVEKCFTTYNNREHIIKWNFADESWECPFVKSDFTIGGKYISRMQDKSNNEIGFDYEAIFDEIIKNKLVASHMIDDRKVVVRFDKCNNNNEPNQELTLVTVTFDQEYENSRELQQSGWQAILNNYKKYTENN